MADKEFNPEPLERAEESAKEIGRLLKAMCPKDWGFVLILMSHGDDGRATYLSSLRRKDMIKALREMATHLEKGKKML